MVYPNMDEIIRQQQEYQQQQEAERQAHINDAYQDQAARQQEVARRAALTQQQRNNEDRQDRDRRIAASRGIAAQRQNQADWERINAQNKPNIPFDPYFEGKQEAAEYERETGGTTKKEEYAPDYVVQARKQADKDQADEPKRIADFEKKHTKLPDGNYISNESFDALPPRYQDIAKRDGFDGLRRTIANDQLTADLLADAEKSNQTWATAKLEPYAQKQPFIGPLQPGEKRENVTVSYDIGKYLRENPDNEQPLLVKNFEPKYIKAVKDYNRDNYGTGLPDNGKNTPVISREQFMQNVAGDKVGVVLPDFKDPDYEKQMAVFNREYAKAAKTYENKYGKKAAALSMAGAIGEFTVVPVARVIRPEVKAKDLTWVDWALTGAVVATAAIPGARMVAGGVRAGKPLGKAALEVAISEVKAPFRPVNINEKIKVGQWGDMAETVVRPSKVPLEAVEIRKSTVRIPVQQTGLSENAAMALRSKATSTTIEQSNNVAAIADRTLELRPSIMNRTAKVAVHATPDVRPFMEGIEITSGREGGLFVAPTLHTRFTGASAFGDTVEGGVSGALIIRDEKIINAMVDSKKIYKGTTEIERVIPGGTTLPKPSQVLMTRDLQGNKLTMLVFGEKFTPVELTRMKLAGPSETISQMFAKPYKLGKVSEELADEIKQVKALGQDLKAAKQAKNAKRVEQLGDDLKHARRRADDIAEQVNVGYRGQLQPAIVSLGTGRLIGGQRSSPQDRALRADTRGATTERAAIRTETRNEAGRTDTERGTEPIRQGVAPRVGTTDRMNTIEVRTEPQTMRQPNPPERIDPPEIRTLTTERINPPTERIPDKATPHERPNPPNPPKIKLTKTDQKDKPVHTAAELARATTWKQGIGYWTVFFDKSVEWSKNKPEGVKFVAGPDANKPGATIQVRQPKLGARVTTFDADLGIQDVKVSKQSGKILNIRFKQDRGQRTNNRVNLKLHSEKRGKIFHTRIGKGEVISRMPL